ncbi:MAG TPA: FecR family protein, partial [Candidatus Polarisedimenticolaceae bacterium]|nr:FecR family protein [Candidatus Polarisedimenticolaceae bacterium]
MDNIRRWTISAALLAGLAGGLVAPAWADDEAEAEPQGDEYRSGDYGRVRVLERGGTLTHAASDDDAGGEEPARTNAPIFPGDALSTATRQRAEVQLAGGTLVRLDQDSAVTFLSLPSPYAEQQDNTVLQLETGTMRLAARVGSRDEFRVDTPASSVYLRGDGDFRIEVLDGGTTRVQSRRGVAEVVGEDGSVLVRGGEQVEVEAGSMPDEAEPFNTFALDSFDRWIADLDDGSRRRYDDETEEAYEELPDTVRPYYGELSTYGQWIDTPDYGYVWSPYNVATDWRPYNSGYWDYGPHGYFWVSSEPWGWAPYHYGRWTHLSRYGWCWSPGRVFGGSWVAWSWGSVYLGWAPLDYWGYPAYVGSLAFGYYDPLAWTFLPCNFIHYHDYSHVWVTVNHVGDGVRHSAIITRPPRFSPRDLSRSAAARSAAFRQAGSESFGRMERKAASATRASARSFRDQEARIRPGGAARPGPAFGRPTSERFGNRRPTIPPGSNSRATTPRYPRGNGGTAAPPGDRGSWRRPAPTAPPSMNRGNPPGRRES